MKFKNKCSQKSKKPVTKKLISNTLIVGLVASNISISQAGILSEDGRSETFEGNNITINDVLSEDEVDVEIEGNTMVNVANQKDSIPITKSYTVEETNHIPFKGEYDGKARPIIEGNTMYYNNDTGELTDTFIEGANLSLVSSFEDSYVEDEIISKISDINLINTESISMPNYTISGNVITNHIASDGSAWTSKPTIASLEASTQYTMIIKNKSNFDVCFQSGSTIGGGNYPIGTVNANELYYKSFTTSSESNHLNLAWKHWASDEITVDSVVELYLIKGDASNLDIDNYNKYKVEYKSIGDENKESIKTFYLNSPLLEGDTIENVNGKATHVKRYSKVVLDGSNDEIWHNRSDTFPSQNTMLFGSRIDDTISSDNTISNRFLRKYPSVILNEECFNVSVDGDGYAIYIRINKNRLSQENSNGLKEWLKNNPTEVLYMLENPTYEVISEEPLIIDSFKGGHLDLNTDIPVNKVEFKATSTELNYLYPDTEYTVQFKSDNTGKIDRLLLGDEVVYSDYSVNKGINRFNITTPSEIASTELMFDGVGFNLSELVVTEATDESFDYFEGLKSSFEDQLVTQEMVNSGEEDIKNLGKYKVEIKSTGKNLFNNSFELGHIVNGVEYYNTHIARPKGFLKVKAGATYTISKKEDIESNYRFERVNFYSHGVYQSYSWNRTFTVPVNCNQIKFTVANAAISELGEVVFSDIDFSEMPRFQLEEGSVATEYEPYKESVKTFYLDEPLRGLPNGVKDRIIKRNGQWVVERETKEIVLNGDEDWVHYYQDENQNSIAFISNNVIGKKGGIVLTDSIIYQRNGHHVSDFIRCGGSTGKILIQVSKSKLKTENTKGLIEWLSENPVTVVYELAEPVYESLNIDSTINLFKETTHISNNSNIPVNMKITIDRTPNRVGEAIELAKINPTSENLSRARMWVNLLKESTLKDEFQAEINGITNVSDITLERKSATANLDVYIKSENMLSMSLNTNSITFDNYSGVEDMELEDAIEISINSSLPYDLNAYLESEIQNTDKSATMNMDLLKIKDSTKDDYQSFANTSDKIILNEDHASGNFNSHSIDLKLEGDDAHSVDVYKTTIRFEAIQK